MIVLATELQQRVCCVDLPRSACHSAFHIISCPTVPRISGGRSRELARVADCPLHTLDGRRVAPDRRRMVIRGTDGAGAERLRPPCYGDYIGFLPLGIRFFLISFH